MIVVDQHPALLNFANEILEVKFQPENCKWISSVTEKNEIMGVIVYSMWTTHNCEMSVASVTPKFLTRAFIKNAFYFPLVLWGLSRVTAVVEEDNHKALKMNHGLGFTDEGILRNWYGAGRNGIAMGMLKEECKWLD
jgi:RimJ/RimL family protein N-acetyltransferase